MKNLIKYISLIIITLGISSVTASADNYAPGSNFQKGNEADNRGNYKEALKWFRLAADQGVNEAAVRIGLMYHNGNGVPQNYAEAIKWYNLAIELGNSAASMLLIELSKTKGYEKFGTADWLEAAKWYRLAAEQGDAEAQSMLGLFYSSGQGVSQDVQGVYQQRVEAVKWYRLAANQDYAQGQHGLGLKYDKGQGVPQDFVEAVKWYRLAAEQGHIEAQAFLGIKYYNGEGVPQDDVMAYMWFNLAAARGYDDAKTNKEIIEKNMTRQQIAEGQRLSREWFNEH